MPETIAATKTLHLPEHELDQVRAILQQFIPGRKVWAFGSRAMGSRMLKRFSDLDLIVEGKLTWSERAELAEAFDESALPVKVDVVELGWWMWSFGSGLRRTFWWSSQRSNHASEASPQ